MDISRLAKATVFILDSHLPTLVRGDAIEHDGDAAKETTDRLWARLHSTISAMPTVMAAVRAAADARSEGTLDSLSRQFEVVFNRNAALANEVAAIIGDSTYAPLLDPTMTVRYARDRQATTRMTPTGAAPGVTGLVCSVCGRQDETLRVVAYPYVVSVVFMTFRRSFAGLWCRRHATLYHILATLLTATLGWFGVPFGLLFTPVALFTLARGGNMPADVNFRMLSDLARHKLGQAKPHEAIRCFEAALRFKDTDSARDELARLYQEYGAPPSAGGGLQLLLFTGAMLAAALLGFVIGVLSALSTRVLSPLYTGWEASFLLTVLSWVPMALMAFVGGMIVAYLIEGTLQRTRTCRWLLGGALAVACALLAAYAIPTGEVLTIVILDPTSGLASMSFVEAIFYLGAMLTRGGVLMLDPVDTVSTIYLLIVLAAAGFYLLGGIAVTRTVVAWQRRLAAIRESIIRQRQAAPATGWLSIAGVVLGLAFLTLLFWFGGPGYGDSEALAHAEEGFALYDQGEMGRAMREFEAAIEIDPEASPAYLGLGLVYVARDQCEEAVETFEMALDLVPYNLQSFAYYGLGEAHLCQGRYDRAAEAYEQSVTLDPDDQYVQLKLGMAYARQGEFERAAEQLEATVARFPEWSAAHAFLAIVYYQLDQHDAMDHALEQAVTLVSDDFLDRYMLGMLYYELNKFSTAEAYLVQANKLEPDSPDLLIALAETYSLQKKYDLALETIDRVLAFDEDNVDAYVARSDVYIQQENLDGALEVLTQVLEIDPENWYIHDNLSYVYYHQGRTTQALEEAQEAVRLAPFNSSAYSRLAFAYHADGQADKALEAAQEAVRLWPKYDTSHYILGLCYMDAGEDEQAIAEFETFLDLHWDRAYVRDYKAQAETYLAELRAEQ